MTAAMLLELYGAGLIRVLTIIFFGIARHGPKIVSETPLW